MHQQMTPGRSSADFLDPLRRLYEDMDRAYRGAASAAGFVCNGCRDSCCQTLFYHHTHAECVYLLEGFGKLPDADRFKATERAAAYLKMLGAGGGPGLHRAAKPMCPLNVAGRCILYEHRPMICRLHGIPHEFSPPGQSRQTGPGCDDFYRQCGRGYHRPLERTPHYRELAQLEIRLRQSLGLARKIKLTVAEMLLQPSGFGFEGDGRP